MSDEENEFDVIMFGDGRPEGEEGADWYEDDSDEEVDEDDPDDLPDEDDSF